MKRTLLYAGLLAMCLLSCNRLENGTESNDEQVRLVVRAILGDAGDTKTVVHSDGTSIYWTPGNAINVFYGNLTSGEFTTTITEPVAIAEFFGTLGAVTGTNIGGGTTQKFWGVYPYNAANTCSGNSVTLTIPSAQGGVAGTFADNLNPSVATSPGLDLAFYNVGSWFIFSVSRDDIVSATFKGRCSETLVGTVTVEMDDNGRPLVTEVQDGVTSITMTPEGGGCFTPGQQYFMVLIPQTLSDGYSLTMTTTDGSSAEFVSTGAKAFERHNYRRKLNADSGLVFVPPFMAVDLGLTSGLKWAAANLGATAPEEYGDYYAWGETVPYYAAGHSQDSPCSSWRDNKTGYNWASYQFDLGTSNNGPFSKYVVDASYGTVDNKTVLDPEDDAACANMGGHWRMPTEAEWTELLTECSWEWTTQNNVKGMLVTGLNSNTIFIPAAGTRTGVNLADAGVWGNYWSSSLYTGNPGYGVKVNFSSSQSGGSSRGWFYYGRSIRAVNDEAVVAVTGVSLNEDNLTMTVGDTETLIAAVTPPNATNQAVVWSSSNSGVATVNANGTVTAQAAGTAVITVTTKSGGKTAVCNVAVNTSGGGTGSHTYVDLGLTSGLKWATANVGADLPEDYGDYFAWGEIEPYYTSQNPLVWKNGKTGYDWASYQWCAEGSSSKITRYNSSSYYGYQGTHDDKTEFSEYGYADDAARHNWGGLWRTPTHADWTELSSECTWSWITQNGVKGYLVTGSNNNSIFLPAAGGWYSGYSDVTNAGIYGYYWSSTQGPLNYPPANAYYMQFNSANRLPDSANGRNEGRSIRPVTE